MTPSLGQRIRRAGPALWPALTCLSLGDTFTQSARSVDRFELVEVALRLDRPPTGNPFIDATFEGEFRAAGGAPAKVDGFCDSDDGRVQRIRFMPEAAGEFTYKVSYRATGKTLEHEGRFRVNAGARRGVVQVDPEHPFHFLWSGTGEHYFYNSTTAYWLLGWKDDAVIREAIDRLAKLRVNRIRVALNGRTESGMRWKEPMIVANDAFQYRLEPWPSERPFDIANPGYDVSRFNPAHFRKAERMLAHAQSRDVVVSLIFHLDGADPGVDPFGKTGMGGPDERRYYRYCVARFGAFANVMWDLANEYRHFRDDAWAEKMGGLIRSCDPYRHLMSVHGHGDFRFRTASWADFAMYQSWDEHGAYDFLIRCRNEQLATGRPMPQVNEEYGYEDHYPYPWGEKRVWPARTAETRRRLAWEMTMAGASQTTGERANVAGMGGWITGRGDPEMTMLAGYGRMRAFFEQAEWWRLDPHPELVRPAGFGSAALCLAEPGRSYVVYLGQGGAASVDLAPGRYHVERFNPRTGASTALTEASGGATWTSPQMPDTEDWALRLAKIDR
jgi:Protein of unknown function (DUF4038)/Domain of unknown function (DUF5060)